jgi:hypothetical protein
MSSLFKLPSTSSTDSRSASVIRLLTTISKLCLNSSKSTCLIVSPAAIACPPNFKIKSGWCLLSKSSASRRCKPAIERPEPLSKPCPSIASLASAKAITGRWKRSLMRDAKMPITPWCQSAWYMLIANWLLTSISSSDIFAASCISASMLRRCTFKSCNFCAILVASNSVSASKHCIPSVMSSNLPAAFSLGPT